MAKTLGKVLSIAIAPISLINKRAGEIISGVTLTAIGIVTANPGLIAVGIGEFSAGIASKPPGPHGDETQQKTGIPDRVGAYGLSGLMGKYTLYQTDPNSGVAGDAYAFMDCWWAPIEGTEGLYFGDDRVARGAGIVAGLPDKSYTDGKVEIDIRLGNRVNTAFSQLIALFPSVTAKSRGDGVVTAMVTWQPVKSKNYTIYYPKGQPGLRMVARWSKVYDWRDDSQSLTDPLTWKWSENPVLHYVHYELIRDGQQPTVRMVIDGAENPAFAPQLASILQAKWDRLFEPTLTMLTAAANDCDDPTAIQMFRTVVSADDSSDSDHTILIANAQGLTVGATITISALDNINHTEIRNVTSISGSASTGYTIGLDSEVAYFHGQGSTVTWQSTSANPLYEPRYRSCVSHSLTDAHKDTKGAIISTFDGWVAPREDGALVVYSGRFVVPTATIGADEIVTSSRDDGVEDENACNEVIITYTESALDYKIVDCEAWRDEDDIAKRGRIASQSLQNQVPSYTQARRLAKRQLARLMAPYRGTVTTNEAGRTVIGQRYIHLQIIQGGATFYDGPAEITSLTNNLQTGGVTFDWVAADPNIDSWDPLTEAGDPAPVGNVVSATSLSAPIITSASPNFGTDSATGVAGVFIDLTVEGAPIRDDVTWSLQTRVQGAAIWGTRSYDDITPGASIELSSEYVPADAIVEIEAAYTVGDGRTSDWSETVTVDTSSANVPPARVTGFAVTSTASGSATATYNTPNSNTLAYEKVYRSTSNSFSTATLVDTYADPAGVAASHTFSEPTGATRYYWCTTISTGGAESTPVGPVGPVTIM